MAHDRSEVPFGPPWLDRRRPVRRFSHGQSRAQLIPNGADLVSFRYRLLGSARRCAGPPYLGNGGANTLASRPQSGSKIRGAGVVGRGVDSGKVAR